MLLACLAIVVFVRRRSEGADCDGLDAYLTDNVRTKVLRLRAMKADGLEEFYPDNPTPEELALLVEHYTALASDLDRLDPPGGIAAWHDRDVHLWRLDAEMAVLRAQGLSRAEAASTVVPADQNPWADFEQARHLALTACPGFADLFPPLPSVTPEAAPTR